MAAHSLNNHKKQQLKKSLFVLNKITQQAYNNDIRSIALSLWDKNLSPENPQWKYVQFKPFFLEANKETAHVFAMVDDRMHNIGIVGYFACTSAEVGSKVLRKACDWLKSTYNLNDVYGPINGTLPNDYRINLKDDFVFPGEPVNPRWYLDAFRQAGFIEFNRYGSGKLKHFNLVLRNAFKRGKYTDSRYSVRPFVGDINGNDFKKYHDLRNRIFPFQSVYCAPISLEERVYNSSGKFDPKYTYFLLDKEKEVGFAMAYLYNKQLIFKTIGILPEYRGKQLSRLLLDPIHKNAIKDGARTAIYALVREGNEVHKRKHPLARVFRHYVTMHKSL